MLWIGAAGPKQNHFSVEVTLNDPGLYFYYFDLYTDFRRIVRGPDNCGVVSWQDGEKWQITVYDAAFETPESIKGKVFYQIFPDRFCEACTVLMFMSVPPLCRSVLCAVEVPPHPGQNF